MPLHTTKEQMDRQEAIANKEKLVELYDEIANLKKENKRLKAKIEADEGEFDWHIDCIAETQTIREGKFKEEINKLKEEKKQEEQKVNNLLKYVMPEAVDSLKAENAKLKEELAELRDEDWLNTRDAHIEEKELIRQELRKEKKLVKIQQDYYKNLKEKFEEMELDYKIKARIAELQNTTIKKYFEIFKEKDKEIELIKSSCKHPDFDWNEFCPWNHCEYSDGFVDTNTYYYNKKYGIHLCKTCFRTTTEGKELFKLVE